MLLYTTIVSQMIMYIAFNWHPFSMDSYAVCDPPCEEEICTVEDGVPICVLRDEISDSLTDGQIAGDNQLTSYTKSCCRQCPRVSLNMYTKHLGYINTCLHKGMSLTLRLSMARTLGNT